MPDTRLDVNWRDGAPTVRLWPDATDPSTYHDHPLTPVEALAIIRRLSGHLSVLHRDRRDRTDESRQANPDIYEEETA